MNTVGVADLLERELKEGKMMLDWFGRDPFRIVSTSLTMRFIKPGKGMVASKLSVTFRGEDGAREIARLLNVLKQNVSESTWRSIVDTLPRKVKAAVEGMQPEAVP